MTSKHYIIRGGVEGRERLRLLSRVMQPTTLELFARVGVEAGTTCLDVGCGGGDVTLDLARLVGPEGKVVGMDIDGVKLDLARREAETQQLAHVEYRLAEIGDSEAEPQFDLVYARFLLTHLKDRMGTVGKMQQFLRPGGLLVLEDIDFTGIFCHPECAAVRRYVELYTEAVRRRGGDANIGPQLPCLLAEVGFERIGMNVVQPAGMEGEAKLMSPLTMENIADAVLAEGLASQAEVEQLVPALYDFARDPRTVVSLPRVVQAWGHRPSS
jgi:SAM-dependent methyltransferase